MNSQTGTVLLGLSANAEINIRTNPDDIRELHRATTDDGVPIIKRIIPASHMRFSVAGSSVNVARALIRAGHRDVKLLGTVGDDHWGHLILQTLQKAGIDFTSLLARNTTSVSVNQVTTGASPALLSSNVKGEYQSHLMPTLADRVHAEVIKTRPSYRVATGVQIADGPIIEGMFRPANASDGAPIDSTNIINLGATLLQPSQLGVSVEQERVRWLGKILKLANLLALNYDESAELLASLSISRMDELRDRIGNANLHILVTRGPDGLSYHRPGEEKIQLEAFPAAELVDPTGAGDCLLGNYIARLIAGDSLHKALTFGIAASALSVGKMGGDCSPTMNETMGFISRSKR
ncbi:carbohydrate kinase family protein [Patescibacteria group bacterium]